VLILASFYGVFAGLAGIEHGIFKLLQGNVRADGIMIELIDLSYQPVLVSNALKPAMSIIPIFIVTGILAIALGSTITIWSAKQAHCQQYDLPHQVLVRFMT
jgi:hypothetical protein